MNIANNSPPKLLIIAPAWIGDTVIAQALFKLLKRHQPEAIIDILALPHLQPLLERMPEINTVYNYHFKHGEFGLKKRIAIANKIRKLNYDQAIVLPNSWKSALIPFLAKIHKRTGWRGEMRYLLINDLRILDKNKLPLMVQRFFALGMQRNAIVPKKITLLPKLLATDTTVTTTLQKFNLHKTTRPVLALCIGAEYGESKRWPADYFATVAKHKVKAGWDVWLLGSIRDQENAAIIKTQVNNNCIDLTGKTDLGNVVDLLKSANIIISNDTGLMHIAAALDLPLIAIYGSSTPKFTPPLSAKAKTFSLNLNCSPCFKRKCPLGKPNCLLNLKPEIILKALKEIENEYINY